MNKSKLFSSIFIALLSLACLCVGVYAAIKASQNVSASVNFNPNGVFVEMSGQIYRGEDRGSLYPIYEDSTYTLKPCRNFRILDETEDESKEPFYSTNVQSWTFNPVKFFPQHRWIHIELKFKNFGKDNITVVPTKVLTITNVTVKEEAASTLLIKPGETKAYRLNLRLNDSVTTTMNTINFSMSLDIRKTSEIETAPSYFEMDTTDTTTLKALKTGYTTGSYGQKILIIPESLGVKSLAFFHSTYVNYGTALQNISPDTKYVVFPEGLEDAYYAFNMSSSYEANMKVEHIYFPESASTCIVSGLGTLLSVELGGAMSSIGSLSFQDCSSLMSLVIPSGVKEIEDSPFRGCSSLQQIFIPSSVEDIPLSEGGSVPFLCCEALKIYCEATAPGEGWAENWNMGFIIDESGENVESVYICPTYYGVSRSGYVG